MHPEKLTETNLPAGNKQIIRVRRIASVGFVLTAAAIAVLSLLPDPPQPNLDIPFLDKIEHFIAYAVLGGLAAGAFWSRQQKPFVLAASAFFCSVFGGILEILQFFTGRSMELGDLIADTLGVAAGAVAGLLIFKTIFRRAAAYRRPGVSAAG